MESTSKPSSSNNPPQDDAWNSLVTRSMAAWDPLDRTKRIDEKSSLGSCSNLDDFLRGASAWMFWFFQTREAFLSQKTMTKWSRDNLDSYVLLPATRGYYANRLNSFFVSHFWHSPTDPDPGGKYLRLLQNDLRQQEWQFIWVDWTCAPQEPRTKEEDDYFTRTLETMPALIRNTGFIWHYPPFEPQLWILYEVAEFQLTSDQDHHMEAFEDMENFAVHVKEMLKYGVQPTLEKHNYRCSYARDKDFITSWLELLVLLRSLEFDIDLVRKFMDNLTWLPGTGKMVWVTTRGTVELRKFKGTLTVDGHQHRFTPFPQWKDGKYSGKTWGDLT
ncbi:hypothetical protein V8F06_005180 [Rhypophila decipiens]